MTLQDETDLEWFRQFYSKIIIGRPRVGSALLGHGWKLYEIGDEGDHIV